MNGSAISRRQAMIALAGTPVSAPIHPRFAAAGSATSGPPVARVEPVTEEFFGQKIVDPYRWMENSKGPDWEPFMRGQAAYARRVLDAIPSRKRIYARIAPSGDAAVTRSVQSCGGRIFYEHDSGLSRPAASVSGGQLPVRALDAADKGDFSPIIGAENQSFAVVEPSGVLAKRFAYVGEVGHDDRIRPSGRTRRYLGS
jgi:prolyl oligopeptidase family protein